MTRDEVEATLKQARRFGGFGLDPYFESLLAHDAEQRQDIDQLQKDLDLLKSDDAERCTMIRDMEEEERKKDAVIKQQAQQISTLREALKTWQSLFRQAVNVAGSLTNYVDDRPELHHGERRLKLLEQQAQQAIKEVL